MSPTRLKPKVSSRQALKKVTINLTFDCWNALMGTNEPRQVIESMIADWYTKYLDGQTSYVVSSNKPATVVDLGAKSNPELLLVLREDLARSIALGRLRKAEALRVKIAEMERDILLLKLQEKEEESSK